MRKSPSILIIALVLAVSSIAAQNTKQELNDQMWEAARKGDAAQVAALLDKGADVNAKFRYGTTALFKAAERGHTEVVKLLLARGADATVRDTFYQATAMFWALDNNNIEVVRALLEKDPSSASDVLMSGARGGKPALVELALTSKTLKPETLTSALVIATNDKEKAAIAEMLTKAGAKPPMEIDAATLASYSGRYKPENGPEIAFDVRDGKFFATPLGRPSIMLMALDQTTFRPAEFEGLVVSFTVENNQITGMTLKQGPNTTIYKKQ